MSNVISQQPPLIVGISSRALFDLSDSHTIYKEQGVESYRQYQIEHEEDPLEPGAAFSLVQKLVALNEGRAQPMVEVILLSRNSADTGLRVFNSIEKANLRISRAVFTSGKSPHAYGQAFGTHLFLSAHAEDVKNALQSGYAAAHILHSKAGQSADPILRIAFDGDAVLFGDESERIYQEQGLLAFQAQEKAAADKPLSGGPFKGFLSALATIQQQFSDDDAPIRTALVTARCAPAHERVIRTLRAWGIRIDEALFLGGLRKAEFLQAFGADIFFDDQRPNCEYISDQVATGHVPHGVTNEDA